MLKSGIFSHTNLTNWSVSRYQINLLNWAVFIFHISYYRVTLRGIVLIKLSMDSYTEFEFISLFYYCLLYEIVIKILMNTCKLTFISLVSYLIFHIFNISLPDLMGKIWITIKVSLKNAYFSRFIILILFFLKYKRNKDIIFNHLFSTCFIVQSNVKWFIWVILEFVKGWLI